MNRLIPLVVSFLGSLGLATALAYLLLIVRAFAPGGDPVIDFLIGRSDEEFSFGFLLVMIPYVLLLVHMVLRIRVGDWLLARGAEEIAMKYATRRMKPNPLRARKEAVAHRTVVARVHMRRMEYEEAWKLLDEVRKPPRSGQFLARLRRWQLETALRRENLVDAHDVVDATGTIRKKCSDTAALHACIAEIAIRENDAEAAREALDRADWAHEGHLRTRVVRAFYTARFDDDEIPSALRSLDECSRWLEDVPGAAAEVLAVRARLLARQGEIDTAREMLEQAASATADARSEWMMEQVGREVEEMDGAQDQ